MNAPAVFTRAFRHGVLAAVERVTGLTGLGVSVAVAAVGGVLLGRSLDSAGLTVLAYALALVLVVVWVMSRRRVTVSAERSSLPHRVTVGRRVGVDLTITSAGRHSAVVIEEALPDSLGDEVRLAVPTLAAGESTQYGYGFTADRRGRFQVGPLVLERTDPFGVVRSRQVIAEPVSFVVHPRTEPVVDRILSREFEDPIVRPPHSKPWPTGAEFYGMRPYVYGDDLRRIVWSAVARSDELVVRESEHGITDSVCVLLDTAHSSYHGRELSPGFERAVSVAASVAGHHLACGFATTVQANSGPLVERLRGKHKRVELLDALADVARERESLNDSLHRLLRRRGGDGHHVVITSNLNAESAAALRLFIERGRSVSLVLVLDEHTDPMTLNHAMGLRCPIIDVDPTEALARPFQAALNRRPR